MAIADLAQDLARALDPVQLFREAFGQPDPWQEEALRSTASRLLMVCSRQAGKTSVAATLAYHTAAYMPGSLVVLLAPAQRQAMEALDQVMKIHRVVSRRGAIPSESETAMRLALSNGSRILSVPGKEGTIRGLAKVRLLVIDESGWVDDDLYRAVTPMLAVSRGRLVALGTPHGTLGWFYESWRAQDRDWDRYEIPATMCPRISSESLEQYRRENGDYVFNREYMCVFQDAETQPFGRVEIENCFREDIKAWVF